MKKKESILGMAFFGPALILLTLFFIPADGVDTGIQFYRLLCAESGYDTFCGP